MKVDKFGLLYRHFHGYCPVCFLTPATLLRLPGRLNLGLILGLNTRAI